MFGFIATKVKRRIEGIRVLMKKPRKIVIVISAVFALIGLAAVVLGKICGSAQSRDIASLTEADIGQRVVIVYDEDTFWECDDGLYGIEAGESEEDIRIIPLRGELKHMLSSDRQDTSGENLIVSVKTVTSGTDILFADYFRNYAQNGLEKLKKLKADGIPEDSTMTEEKLDSYIEMMEELASDEAYEKNRSAVTAFELVIENGRIFSVIENTGTCVTALMLLILIYALLGIRFSCRKLVLGTLCLVVLTVGVTAFILRKDIKTMLSVRNPAPGIYTVHVENDYKLDKILADGTYDEGSLVKWISENLFWNIPIEVDLSAFGCSSFACVTPEGDHIFGRNMDCLSTDVVLVYSAPEDGYASISVCDPADANMAGENKFREPDSLFGRAFLRAAAYMPMDGVNEAGLGISTLTTAHTPMYQETGKTGIYMTVAIRAILDKCATVDEALALLQEYDMKSLYKVTNHLFITDRSGHSVVVEWEDNEMKVVEADAVTNFVMSKPEHEPCERYDTIVGRFEETGRVMSCDDAMDLLMDVSQNGESIKTQWSCVYDLDNFKMYLVTDANRADVYEITPEFFDR